MVIAFIPIGAIIAFIGYALYATIVSVAPAYAIMFAVLLTIPVSAIAIYLLLRITGLARRFQFYDKCSELKITPEILMERAAFMRNLSGKSIQELAGVPAEVSFTEKGDLPYYSPDSGKEDCFTVYLCRRPKEYGGYWLPEIHTKKTCSHIYTKLMRSINIVELPEDYPYPSI